MVTYNNDHGTDNYDTNYTTAAAAAAVAAVGLIIFDGVPSLPSMPVSLIRNFLVMCVMVTRGETGRGVDTAR